ncbi:hypothetical protein GCM10009854_24070 [Saccharopolyspora halophila]|uniref:Uncharacterized protein n=1 Tax=Saccharopolyspora halophila TaxID=405551 RepID=A0ABN3G8B7_9PSEU
MTTATPPPQVADLGHRGAVLGASAIAALGGLLFAPNAEVLMGLDFLISISVLTLINALTATGLFWIYGAFGILFLVCLHRNLPETKNRTLEDIESSLRARSKA